MRKKNKIASTIILNKKKYPRLFELSEEKINNYIEKFINLELSDGNKIENYIWEVFEKANNSPAFEGAGAHGTIYFYIKNNLVELQNNYWEYNYDDDGNIDWDQEENIIECEEEKF